MSEFGNVKIFLCHILPPQTVFVSSDIWALMEDRQTLKDLGIKDYSPDIERMKVQSEELQKLLNRDLKKNDIT